MGRKSRDRVRREKKKSKKSRDTKEFDTNIGKVTEIVSKQSTTVSKYKYIKPACHSGFKEIHEHLFVGRESDLNSEILKKIDVLVPLNDLNARIWDKGYRNDIMYVPIKDFSTLPLDVERKYAKTISDLVKDGKNVAIFCLGGHGRTGYLASLVLFELGYKNPIHLLKTQYCNKAVESYDQLEAIAIYCDNDALLEVYEEDVIGGGFFWDYPSVTYSNPINYPKGYGRSTATPYTDAYFTQDEDEWLTNHKTSEEQKKQSYLEKIERIFADNLIEDNDDEDEESELKNLLAKENCSLCGEEEDGYCILHGHCATEYDSACGDFFNK